MERPAEDELFLCAYPDFPQVAEIVFNRPRKLNALTLEQWRRLTALVRECEQSPHIRVIVLRGVDASAFCAGADISEFPSVRRDRVTGSSYQEATEAATRAIKDSRCITIAAIRGICFGGGMQLASACDIRLGSTTSRYALTPARMGAVYGPYETELLMRVIGEARARDLLLTGRSWTSEEALQAGFLTACYEDEVFDERFRAYLQTLLSASRAAQEGIRAVIEHVALGQADCAAADLAAASLDSVDYREGFAAFLAKRPADFPSNRSHEP